MAHAEPRQGGDGQPGRRDEPRDSDLQVCDVVVQFGAERADLGLADVDLRSADAEFEERVGELRTKKITA
ncbi:hypothetical protein [Streptomyces sp. NPDC090445]|uniref:hypothetical protein n=1 Tax=Streptomyces sp. NPDC090445 TaxID=3365963 RepID=UPI003805660E